jgi:dTDP-4-amino-4,6-dideoxyglucose formyltransferase
MRTLILTDNPFALELARDLERQYVDIDVFQSPGGKLPHTAELKVKDAVDRIIADYGLVVSIHCTQMFPPRLVEGVRCINVHPGLNPYNRGWYPQVFSLINGLPCGVTIHEIDNELDHGPIIVQQAYEVKPWDTSGSVYAELMRIERALVEKHFGWIRDTPRMTSQTPEGNINCKRDFEALRQIDLSDPTTMGGAINRLRALTHGSFKNAYFLTDDGRRVFVRIVLEPEGYPATSAHTG